MSAAGRVLARWGSGLATLALHAETFGERGSWRLGQAGRGVALALHEALTRAAHATGLGEMSSEEVERAWRAAPRPLPPYAAQEAPPRGAPSRRCETLRRGRVPASGGAEIPIERVTFREMPDGSPSMLEQFKFYSLDDVEALRDAHDRTGDPSWLDAARAVARQWIRACLQTETVPHVWDDHIAAVRALVLARLWCALRARGSEGATPEERRRLAEALARHARRLALPAFYREHHNHGVTQAVALLVAGVLLESHPEAVRWVETGVERLRAQARDNVTVAGSHREHSPFYHFYVYRQLVEAAQWAATQGIVFDAPFHERLRAMAIAGAHMIQPDGALAPLGDTHRASYSMEPPPESTAQSDPEAAWLRWSATAGAGGEAPPFRWFRDDEAGWLFARSGWGRNRPYRSERYFTLRLRTAPTSHIHADLLAVTWHGFGADLLVDAGGPFGYGTAWRRDYFLRTRAHNTISCDDLDRPVGAGRVERFHPEASWIAVDAASSWGEGIEHRRCVLAHDAGLLILVDRVRAPRPRAFAHRLHLGPSFEVRRDSEGAAARDDARGVAMNLLARGTVPLGTVFARGVESPPEGWICAGDLRREPTTTVRWDFQAADAVVATLVVAGAPSAPEFDLHVTAASAPDGDAECRIRGQGLDVRIAAPVAGPATVEVTGEGSSRG